MKDIVLKIKMTILKILFNKSDICIISIFGVTRHLSSKDIFIAKSDDIKFGIIANKTIVINAIC